jgi:hypothetical protein
VTADDWAGVTDEDFEPAVGTFTMVVDAENSDEHPTRQR